MKVYVKRSSLENYQTFFHTRLRRNPAYIPEVARVTFSDPDSAPVPNFWIQIQVQTFSNFRIWLLFRLRLPSMQSKFAHFFFMKWPCKLLILPKIRSDSG